MEDIEDEIEEAVGFIPKGKSYVKVIKQFIEYYEGGGFEGDTYENFQECMDKIGDSCPGTLEKKWRYNIGTEPYERNPVYRINWIEKGVLEEFSFEDDSNDF